MAKEFLCGGLAAMSASSVTHPIDLIKVRMLLFGEQEKGKFARLDIVKMIYRESGVRGFYNGLTAALLRQALFSTTRFGFYDIVKKALGETKDRALPYHRKIVATMTGGSLAALIACPADLMLVRMQSDGRLPPEQRRNYRNPLQGMYRVAREEGIVRGLYRGAGPLVARGLAVTTAQFSTYDQIKESLIAAGRPDSLSTHFTSSLGAGLVAAVVSTPLDVIKSRMMNSTTQGQHGNDAVVYRSSIDCLRQTLRVEGVRGLYKGLVPCYLRMGPQVMLMWVFIEQYRRLWDRTIG